MATQQSTNPVSSVSSASTMEVKLGVNLTGLVIAIIVGFLLDSKDILIDAFSRYE